MELTKTQIEIIKIYLKCVTKYKLHHPSMEDILKHGGITRGQLQHQFGSLVKLRKASKKFSPDTFKNIVDEEIYNPQIFERIKEAAEGYKKFVITTAVTGCPVHKGFYKALKNYCRLNKAMLIILPSTDPASNAGWSLDAEIGKEHIVFSDLALNSNIWISSIKLSAKQKRMP